MIERMGGTKMCSELEKKLESKRMKNRKLISVIVIGLILSSCGVRSDFAKRKYLNLHSKNQIEIVPDQTMDFSIQRKLPGSSSIKDDHTLKPDLFNVEIQDLVAMEQSVNLSEKSHSDTDTVVVQVRFQKVQQDSLVMITLETQAHPEDEILQTGEKKQTKVKNKNTGKEQFAFQNMHPALKVLLIILAIPVFFAVVFLFYGLVLWISGSGF
jgi:hypothetical protein